MTVKPYNAEDPKAEQVKTMFDNIAPRYDFLNHLLSLGIDRGWRKKLVRQVAASSPSKILDIATGTGDLALMMRKATEAEIIGTDISTGMLDIGRRKAEGLDRITFSVADAEALPFKEGEFDTVTAAFGVRNFENLSQGIAEMHRVLRTGGELYVLEFAMPDNRIMGTLYRFYFRHILPSIGRIVSGDKRAYTYLPESVGEFPYGTRFVELLGRTGFREAGMQKLMDGIAIIYKAVK